MLYSLTLNHFKGCTALNIIGGKLFWYCIKTKESYCIFKYKKDQGLLGSVELKKAPGCLHGHNTQESAVFQFWCASTIHCCFRIRQDKMSVEMEINPCKLKGGWGAWVAGRSVRFCGPGDSFSCCSLWFYEAVAITTPVNGFISCSLF